ncbi:hypothetical protein P6B95_00025 [Streptomyces atratus]|nr:hypothetical protein P6B95_00025 [Streptomyces atratus]
MVFHVFAALAEFIRELIVQGTHEGLAAARARGERIGRPPAMTEEQVRHARGLLTDPENTITSVAKLRWGPLPDCWAARPGVAGDSPMKTEADQLPPNTMVKYSAAGMRVAR